jgi:hypothetical protein
VVDEGPVNVVVIVGAWGLFAANTAEEEFQKEMYARESVYNGRQG